MNRLLLTVLAALGAVALLAACGVEDVTAPDEATPPAETPGDEEPRDDTRTDEPEEGRALQITGTFDGDPQLEGGCAWVDAPDGTRYEVLWPEGYEVDFDRMRLLGPEGEEVAASGDTVTVEGAVAEDMASFCMVGTLFEATAVEPAG